jgi:hypothetical protein
MFVNKLTFGIKTMFLSGLLASCISAAEPQSAAPGQAPATPALKPAALAATTPNRYLPNRAPKREGLYYGLLWGIDSLGVKWMESGELVRFTYRVTDPAKAKALNDKRADPSLEDSKAGVKLVVPALEFVGKMRNTVDPEAGKSYWVAFSNKGRLVKRGDRVSVVIGKFRANGLVVE